ncbi:unnamed protein product [Nippostrongylus brasiliensis]|uniref:Uncharacterized protein n=1 Tax=Nippostrongylus brasiliensis TaxID=27835 RepID=A0A0N4YQD3_NIPBR|nr:unnamed protein product [Nippostrongylus brasiliensis]
MPPPSRGNPKAGKRTSQKQQRELDAKLHQALRSLMYASYAGEDLTRHSTFVEAQRIVSGNDGRSVKQEVEDECDLDLDPREELRSVQAPVRCPEPIEPERQVMPTYETCSEPFTEVRDWCFSGDFEDWTMAPSSPSARVIHW